MYALGTSSTQLALQDILAPSVHLLIQTDVFKLLWDDLDAEIVEFEREENPLEKNRSFGASKNAMLMILAQNFKQTFYGACIEIEEKEKAEREEAASRQLAAVQVAEPVNRAIGSTRRGLPVAQRQEHIKAPIPVVGRSQERQEAPRAATVAPVIAHTPIQRIQVRAGMSTTKKVIIVGGTLAFLGFGAVTVVCTSAGAAGATYYCMSQDSDS